MVEEQIFSGERSTGFWETINKGRKRDALYAIGCRCQELESLVRELMRRIEKLEKKGL